MLHFAGLCLLLVLAGCASSEEEVSCPALPDTYVMTRVEKRGNCGPLSPEVVHRSDTPSSDCADLRDEAQCFHTLRRDCPRDDDGFATAYDGWIDGSSGSWSGEITMWVEVNGEPYCSSTYAITLEAR
jgi:hypothetical protein